MMFFNSCVKKRICLSCLLIALIALGFVAIKASKEDYSSKDIKMYSTVIEGCDALSKSLSNPNFLEIQSIAYDAERDFAYYLFTADDDYAQRVTSYAAYDGINKALEKSENLKAEYNEAPIKMYLRDVERYIKHSKDKPA